jgi:hypothetical protein
VRHCPHCRLELTVEVRQCPLGVKELEGEKEEGRMYLL